MNKLGLLTNSIHNRQMDNGLVGALIGGGATCVAAYLALHREDRIAREQLLQSRFAPAYLTLQLYISKWADHANWNLDTVRIGPTSEPELPQVSDVEGAQVSLFASDDAVEAMNEFAKTITAYRLAVGSVEQIQLSQAAVSSGNASLASALGERRTTARALVESAEIVHQKLRRELRGKHGWRNSNAQSFGEQNQTQSAPPLRVHRWVPGLGMLSITFATLLAGVVTLSEPFSVLDTFDFGIVIVATGGLDFIFYKMLWPFTPESFNSKRPRLHAFTALSFFVFTLWEAVFIGLTFQAPQHANSTSVATLVIAGMVLPVGASLILAVINVTWASANAKGTT
jgi:hypothetical protein